MIQQTIERPSVAQHPPISANEPDVTKGLIAGAAGGLVATAVMTLFQNAMTKLSEPLTRTDESEQREKEQGESEPATVQAADAVSRAVIGREMKDSHKNIAGQSMHYGFGTAMGMVYGTAAEFSPAVTTGHGSAFGTVLMIGADEIAVPLAGLGSPPTQTPLSTHIGALVAHLVYGVTCEQVRRTVRRSLD